MKLLVDTNVLLDVVLGREPWALEAARLLSAIEDGKVDGYLAGNAVTTVHYVVAKSRDDETARRAVSDLLDLLEVVPPTDAIFRRALTLPIGAYEDEVQTACALRIGADTIVTRNARDFGGAEIPCELAGAVLAQL